MWTRLLFSDFHVHRSATRAGTTFTFPNECDNGGGLTDQERILAFFFFDLTFPPEVTIPTEKC